MVTIRIQLRFCNANGLATYMHRDKHPWFRKRNYLHFDNPVSLIAAEKLVSNTQNVAKHSFFPLIHYKLDSYKIFKDGDFLRKKEKQRPISYASHLDSHVYAYYALQLSRLYENELQQYGLNDNVLAFRSLGKSNIQFANAAFEDVKRRGNCSVIALDVKRFFDNLDHKVLKKAWSELLDLERLPADHFNVFKSLTSFSTVKKRSLYKRFGISENNPRNNRFKVCSIEQFRSEVRKKGLISSNTKLKGIPQGTPISALLSNIYMLKFDNWATALMEEQDGSYYRYCDDMLFITPNEIEEDPEKAIDSIAQEELNAMKLELNHEKTEIRSFWVKNDIQSCDQPLQYLGFTYDGKNKLIRSAALARFSNRMKRGVRLAKETQRKRNSIKRKNGQTPTELYKRKLYERYSHLGYRNFITYGFRAADEMQSKAIRMQLKPLWERLKKEIEK